MENNCSYLSVRVKLEREKQIWLEPTTPKMAEDPISTGPWASLYAYCNTLAKWHTQQLHNSWQLPWQQPEKPTQGLKWVLPQFQAWSTPLFLDKSWIFLPLFHPPHTSLLYMFLHWIKLKSWFGNLSSASPFCGHYKACAILGLQLQLAAQSEQKKNPSRSRQPI